MPEIVVIGSRNPIKIKADRRAFEACFPGQTFHFEGMQGAPY